MSYIGEFGKSGLRSSSLREVNLWREQKVEAGNAKVENKE
jgi:hypothetical protein